MGSEMCIRDSIGACFGVATSGSVEEGLKGTDLIMINLNGSRGWRRIGVVGGGGSSGVRCFALSLVVVTALRFIARVTILVFGRGPIPSIAVPSLEVAFCAVPVLQWWKRSFLLV